MFGPPRSGFLREYTRREATSGGRIIEARPHMAPPGVCRLNGGAHDNQTVVPLSADVIV
jgi:hypothetical protein